MVETKTKMADANLADNGETFYGECLKELPADSSTYWFAYLPIVQLNVFLMFLCGTKNRRDTIPLSVNIHYYNVRMKMWNLSQCTHLPRIWDLKHCSTSQFQTVQWPTPYLWVSGPVNFFFKSLKLKSKLQHKLLWCALLEHTSTAVMCTISTYPILFSVCCIRFSRVMTEEMLWWSLICSCFHWYGKFIIWKVRFVSTITFKSCTELSVW